MHKIPEHITGVTLFRRDGLSRAFASFAAALEALGYDWIVKNVGAHFREFTGHERCLINDRWVRFPTYREAEFILRDDQGRVVTGADFNDLLPRRSYFYRFSFWNGEGPVPGTGGWGNGHYFRHPKTMAERRQAQQVDPDEPAPRPARSSANIPNAWDDYWVASRDDVNWKRFRRTQYKQPRG